MASTAFQVAGLASNFDWKTFVDQIIDLERAPAKRLEGEKVTNNTKVTLLTSLGTKLTALKDAAAGLKTDGLFGQRTAKSATSGSTWTATAASDTATGSYKIAVSQLATSARLSGNTNIGSALNPTTDDVSALTLATLPIGQAVTAGTFTVNGEQVTIALTDSLEDVFDAISTATSGDVTASYDHLTDKVTLTSTNGEVMLGAANDTSNFLRALKLGNNGTNTTASSAALGTVKTTATLATSNLTTAVSGAGSFSINGVSIAYDADTDTLSAVLQRINDSTAGVSAAFDAANDRVTLTNKSTGDLGISVSDISGGLLGALGLTSGTTFTRGDNAEFTINDGATLSSASNTLDVSSHGIEGLSVGVDSETTETVSVSANTAGMRSKIDSFISKFNDVQEFLDSVTKVSTDSKGKVTSAALASNREIQSWASSMRSMAFSTIGGLSGTIDQLDDLGIDFQSGTRLLEVKSSSKLDAALANSGAAVEEFFTKASTGFVSKFDTFLATVTTSNTDQQKRLNNSNTDIDEQIAAIERHLEQRRAIMESAFIMMESAQSKLKSQQQAVENAFPSKSSS